MREDPIGGFSGISPHDQLGGSIDEVKQAGQNEQQI